MQVTEIPDVVPMLAKTMTFQEGLKVSMRERLSVIPKVLEEHSKRLYEVLVKKDPKFTEVTAGLLAQACLDEGLVSRVEFKAQAPGNARAAYVGDALLTLYIAKASFLASKTPKDHQADRTRWCQKNALAAFYDRFFVGSAPLLLTWEVMLNNTPPTAHQKAEFVEAVLGVLSMSGKDNLAALFCSWIVSAPAP